MCAGVHSVCVDEGDPGFTALSTLHPKLGDLRRLSQPRPSLSSSRAVGGGCSPRKVVSDQDDERGPVFCAWIMGGGQHMRGSLASPLRALTHSFLRHRRVLTSSAGHSPSPASSGKLSHPQSCQLSLLTHTSPPLRPLHRKPSIQPGSVTPTASTQPRHSLSNHLQRLPLPQPRTVRKLPGERPLEHHVEGDQDALCTWAGEAVLWFMSNSCRSLGVGHGALINLQPPSPQLALHPS